MHLEAGYLPSVHVNYTNSHQHQGVTGERNKESKRCVTEYLMVAQPMDFLFMGIKNTKVNSAK